MAGAHGARWTLLGLSVMAGGAASMPRALTQPLSGETSPTAKKAHPRLVKGAAAKCASCHASLLQGKKHIHPPVEDCTSCHVVEIGDEATRITLAGAGTALCLGCHDGLQAAADGTLKSPHAPVLDSCTNCHDPHASDEPRLLEAPLTQVCASCHATADLQKLHGGQLTDRTKCARCHLAHGSAHAKLLSGGYTHAPFADKTCEACHRPPMGGRVRLQARGPRLCTSCHSDLEAGSAPPGGSLHAALKAEKRDESGCLSCHDPHLSATAKLLLKPGTALCARCHEGVVGAATDKTGHAPASEDCLGCHRPHIAAQASLLTERPPALCLDCHDGADVKKAHLGADPAKLQCTTCHTPHGSGNSKLLARNVHPPVLEACDTCHTGRFDKLAENGEAALCLACHDDVGAGAKGAKFPHAAMDGASCTACHNPHASAQEKLVNGAGSGPCAACHADQVAGPGEFGHGTIALIGCRSCHEPHGGSQAKLLRATGDALCLGCHDTARLKPPAEGAQSVRLLGRFDVPVAKAAEIGTLRLTPDGKRGHPTPDHPIVGTAVQDPHKRRVTVTFQGELSCLACHDPHKGKAPQLLKGGAASASQACLACHPK